MHQNVYPELSSVSFNSYLYEEVIWNERTVLYFRGFSASEIQGSWQVDSSAVSNIQLKMH